VAEVVAKRPVMGMADLNQQLCALRFQQLGEDRKFLAFQV
jgi:hypothetical protein